MIKSMRMRWEEHEVRMGEMRNAYESLSSLKGRTNDKKMKMDGDYRQTTFNEERNKIF
jgi:hypothetical protein